METFDEFCERVKAMNAEEFDSMMSGLQHKVNVGRKVNQNESKQKAAREKKKTSIRQKTSTIQVVDCVGKNNAISNTGNAYVYK